jgi:hypothetical protein
MKPHELTAIKVINREQNFGRSGRRGPSLQTATISECRYRWLRLPDLNLPPAVF